VTKLLYSIVFVLIWCICICDDIICYHGYRLHYKEYLVSLINKHKIDPVDIMSLQKMKLVFERNEVTLPKMPQNETEARYKSRLQQVYMYKC